MNNYCLRRLRYALNLNDKLMLKLFSLASYQLSVNELKPYLAKEYSKEFVPLPDYLLLIFLDGLIIHKRGKREGEPEMTQAERVSMAKKQQLTNNLVVNKIKIALSLTTESMIDILMLADFRISKSEISAFFRNPNHRNYRECGNQFLRNLLTGITLKYQSKSKDKAKTKTDAKSKTKV